MRTIVLTRKDGTVWTGTVVEVTPSGTKCRVIWDNGTTEILELV